MTKPPLPNRVAGDLALDLVNTRDWRGTPREIDYLADSDGILAWAGQAGLVAPEERFPPAACQQLVAEVHALRRAIEEAAVAIVGGEEPPRTALAVIRDHAARNLADATLSGAPTRLGFSGIARICGPIAWAAFDLLRGDELARLKQCPPEDCRWLFIDRSKNGSRRWCEMATCGNRAKKLRGSTRGRA